MVRESSLIKTAPIWNACGFMALHMAMESKSSAKARRSAGSGKKANVLNGMKTM